MVNEWISFNQSRFLPQHCELCGGRSDLNALICDGCLKDLPILSAACEQCGIQLDEHQDSKLCGACQSDPPSFALTRCLFTYQYPVDRLVQRFKFGEQLILARLFGELMGRSMRAYYAESEYFPQGLLPVPLHPNRLRERGFNQAFELAKFCKMTSGIPILDNCCVRVKDTSHQPGLSRAARRTNLRGAFKITSTHVPKRIALIDDVLTTGTTCETLSQALIKAGVESVHLWCIARAV